MINYGVITKYKFIIIKYAKLLNKCIKIPNKDYAIYVLSLLVYNSMPSVTKQVTLIFKYLYFDNTELLDSIITGKHLDIYSKQKLQNSINLYIKCIQNSEKLFKLCITKYTVFSIIDILNK
ncbi:hypothetical protein A6770_04420 [Nostoc minutum NIES-26]|uniref:Uncharacterized protein n=1 Tax=Nostoc minutum NIES-26 TaxID=1844469 RepID=A0A367QCV1_9NOSO|nr:hypothetical protein A6770_04420 [Nostoc minutum NIES-26]